MIVLDAEWPTLNERHMHMCGTLDTTTGEYACHENPASLEVWLSRRPMQPLCGHRIVYADMPALRDRWGVDISKRELIDTYTLSTLFRPTRLDGGHSLGEWGRRLGDYKGDFTDFDEPAEGETWHRWWTRMRDYMEQDVRLTEKLHRELTRKLAGAGFSQLSIDNELQIARIVQEQIDTGFKFDVEKATSLYVRLGAKRNAIRRELQHRFPPIVTQRWSEKTGKELKPHVEEFNPGSRQQVAKRLMSAGVKLTEVTPSGQYKISDELLQQIPHPVAQEVGEYMMLEKRISQMDGWFKYYNDSTGRIHGKVNPLGTNTHRQSQSRPNLAQIPSTRKPYGKECRELFCVPDAHKLVGIDASALELRLLANRLLDPEFKKQVEEGDVHTYNQQQAGLATRDEAKTFIYAFIYGASDAKLADILKCSVGAARSVRARFLKNMPAFEQFKRRTEAEAQSGTITLLDGSKVWVDSMHSVLNYQLQGDGAVVMKQALINFYPILKEQGAKLVVQAHDEWQIETPYYNADVVGAHGVHAIEQVTDQFDMFVKLTGEYQVGNNWASTH